MDEGTRGVVVSFCGTVTDLVHPSCQNWSWPREETGRFFCFFKRGVERQEADGPTPRRGKRNKCVAFERSMTGSDWLD